MISLRKTSHDNESAAEEEPLLSSSTENPNKDPPRPGRPTHQGSTPHHQQKPTFRYYRSVRYARLVPNEDYRPPFMEEQLVNFYQKTQWWWNFLDRVTSGGERRWGERCTLGPTWSLYKVHGKLQLPFGKYMYMMYFIPLDTWWNWWDLKYTVS